MPLVSFESLPDSARVWIFGASDSVSGDAASQLLGVVDDFLSDWRAHGVPLSAGREWHDDRFLTIALDTREAAASGCSLDALFRVFKRIEPEVGASMLDGSLVFYRDAEGVVRSTDREGFAALGERGEINGATRVFDTTIETLGEWRERFERSAEDSWQSVLLGR